MVDRVGQHIGNYRLLHLLGEGGFAEVYLGEHLHLGTQAAIKILHAQLADDEKEHFRAEARIIAQLEHPNIVRVLDFGFDEKLPYLVMSYAPYGTLRQLYKKGTSIPFATIVASVKQIAAALDYAHNQKLIHRDVKPENMLIGRHHEILLSDFGIALVTQSSHYQKTGDVVGTVAYMAPEQIQGKPRPASDQYALAVVVYEWLTGERPFHGSFTEIAVQHTVTPPPPLREKVPTISPQVEQIVMTALAKDPLRRFATTLAFANALQEASQTTGQNAFSLSGQSSQPFPSFESVSQDNLSTMVATPLSSVTAFEGPSQQSTTTQAQLSRIFSARRPLSRRLLLGGSIALGMLAGGSITWLVLASQKSGTNAVLTPSTNSAHAPVAGITVTSGRAAVTPVASSSPPSPEVTNAPSGPRIVGGPLLTYRGHTNYVYGVSWISDQQHVASASLDTTVQVWSASSGQSYSSYNHSKSVNDVKVSHHSTHIASASDDSTVQVRDAVNTALLLTYKNHGSAVNTVEWSPDSTHIVSASADRTVQIWDAQSGTPVQVLNGHTDVVWAAGWSPDGQYIVSASADNTAKVWNASAGTPLRTYTGHVAVVRTVSWSPDGRRIATGSDDGTVQVWDVSSGKSLLIYRGHTTKLRTVSWSHDGSRIVSGSRDATAQVWNPDNGQTLLIYKGHTATVFDAQWSQDDTLIASCSTDTTVQVWHTS